MQTDKSKSAHNGTAMGTYPTYIPPVPKPENKFLKKVSNVWDMVSGYSRLAGAVWAALTLVSLALVMLNKATKGALPEPLVATATVFGMVTFGVLMLILGAFAIATPFVMGFFAYAGIKNRGNKTDLDFDELNRFTKDLTALGVANAREVVKGSPLQAEAYKRVSLKARKLAMAQGMDPIEANHHAHNLGLMMYPGTAELEREVPLMRLLEDRGVMDANTALTAVAEQQYAAFRVPVTTEEIAASLEPVKPMPSDIMAVIALEEKIRSEGYKPTIAERKKMRGSEAYWGSMFGNIPGVIFGLVSIVGGVFSAVVPFVMLGNGGIDLLGAVVLCVCGIVGSVCVAFWSAFAASSM